MFITTMVMALLAAVIYFVWRYGRGFGIIEALFALYGYASFAADICRWMRLPDAAILQRGGRRGGEALHSPSKGASDGDLHRHDPLRESALRRGDAHVVSGAAVDEGPRAAGKA